jgi:hypothetical protein
MNYILIGLIVLSALAFVLAVCGSLFGFTPLGIPPESFSRACSNLALIAIALGIWQSSKTE